MLRFPSVLRSVACASLLVAAPCDAAGAGPALPGEQTPIAPVEITPKRLQVDSKLVAIVAAARQRSITLRRQWERLEAEPDLVLAIQLIHEDRLDHPHAHSVIEVDDRGRVVATVRVAMSVRLVELLAHEFEHIIERLDGAVVADRHRAGDESVRRNDVGYETARARLVGARAWTEFRLRP